MVSLGAHWGVRGERKKGGKRQKETDKETKPEK